jgi:hypothetical protein
MLGTCRLLAPAIRESIKKSCMVTAGDERAAFL